MPLRTSPAAIRVAIAGCGRIAFLLEQDPLRYKPCTHLGALRVLAQKDRKIKPVAFFDPNRSRARAAAAFLGAAEDTVMDSYAGLLAHKPDLLIIAASTAGHFDLLTGALRAKVPRIVIEKPVAYSASEAQKLRRLVLRHKSLVMPNYERRYHPKYIRLKQQIATAAQPPFYRGFFAAGGVSLYATNDGDEGVLLHDTTHLVDLAQFLFGAVKKHSAVAGKRRHVLHLEHAGGAAGLIETNLDIGVFHLELEIRLSDRRITVGNGFQTTERIAASRYYRNLKSYSEPQRAADARIPVAKNPFVQLYREALYGKPDNAHFLEALDNVILLDGQRLALPIRR
ncbi:MAG: Gfo/Idh/MocA family oxidoreductase [Turneriella sp.]